VKGYVYSVDAESGASCGRSAAIRIRCADHRRTCAAGRADLRAPLSSLEEASGAIRNMSAHVPRRRGGIRAKRGPNSGERTTIPDSPKKLKTNSIEDRSCTDAGHPVWSSPTVDALDAASST